MNGTSEQPPSWDLCNPKGNRSTTKTTPLASDACRAGIWVGITAIPIVALLVVSITCCVVILTDLSHTWYAQSRSSSDAVVRVLGFALVQPVVVVVLFAVCRSGRLCATIGAGIYFVSLCLIVEPNQPGDRWFWVPHANEATLWLSEPGANLYYYMFNKFGLLPLAPPCFGAITYVIIYFSDKRFRQLMNAGENAFPWLLTLYLMSPISILFAYNYVENPQLTIGMLLVAIALLAEFIFVQRSITLAAVVLGVAAFVHGSAMFFLPMIPIAIILRFFEQGLSFRHAVAGQSKQLLRAMVTYVVALLGPLALARWIGFRLDFGNLSGGADKLLFVPLSSDSLSSFARFTMFSLENLRDSSNVIFHGIPCLLALSVCSIGQVINTKSSDRIRFAYFASWVIGYVLFVFLWNFDLGFPADYDLMLAGSVVAIPCTYFLARSILTSRLSCASAGCVAVAMWLSQWITIATTVF
jgi:hypothetical protein